jgi:hypothetical protein
MKDVLFVTVYLVLMKILTKVIEYHSTKAILKRIKRNYAADTMERLTESQRSTAESAKLLIEVFWTFVAGIGLVLTMAIYFPQ